MRQPSPFLYVTASVVHCQSIVQVSSFQVVLNLPLPRYLEKRVHPIARFPISY